MQTKYISLAQLKGGVGKSTLAINIAVLLSKHGKTILLDTDNPQFTSTAWGSIASVDLEVIPVLDHTDFMNKLQEIDGKYDFVVIDSPPRANDIQRSIAVISDYVFIPLSAKPADLWAFDDLNQMIIEAKKENPTAQYSIIWNFFKKYPSYLEIRKQFQEYGYDEFSASLSDYSAYSKMIGEGKHAMNYPNWRTKLQFKNLATEILEKLEIRNDQ